MDPPQAEQKNTSQKTDGCQRLSVTSAAVPKKIHCEVVVVQGGGLIGFRVISGEDSKHFLPVWVMSFELTFYNSSKNTNRVKMGLFIFCGSSCLFVFQLEI